MPFFGVLFVGSTTLPKAEFCDTLSSTVMTEISLAPELVEGWCTEGVSCGKDWGQWEAENSGSTNAGTGGRGS